MELTLAQHVWNVFVAFATKTSHKGQLPTLKYHLGEKENTISIRDPEATAPYRTSPMQPEQGDPYKVYHFDLPADNGTLEIKFHLTEEWAHLPELFFKGAYPEDTFVEGLLVDYCEEANCFMAGVPVALDFTDEELALIDKAREKTGETREEFISTAVKKACDDLAFFDKTTTREPNFTDKIVEVLGEGATVIYRESEDKESGTLIVGLPNREVAVSKVDNALKAYGHDADALKYALQEIATKDCDGQLKGVAYFVFNDTSDPYKVEDLHEGWLKQIKYTFGLEPWTDADSKFGGEA